MSLIPIVFPLLKPVPEVIDDARHDARVQHKQIAAEMGLSASDCSKAIAGKRTFDLHRVANTDTAFQRALYTRLLDALPKPPAPALVPDRDLVAAAFKPVEELVARVDQLLAAMGPWRQAKAELRDEQDERKTA